MPSLAPLLASPPLFQKGSGPSILRGLGPGETLSSELLQGTPPPPPGRPPRAPVGHIQPESYRCSPGSTGTGQTWCSRGGRGPPGVSGPAPSAPRSARRVLAVPDAGPALLAAVPGLLQTGSLCPGKRGDRAIETRREHIPLPAPDQAHCAARRAGERGVQRPPWAWLMS